MFKRFHNCNAYVQDYYGEGIHKFELVSYSTKIAEWYEAGSPSHVQRLIVGDSFNCSNTTIHQFNRWLREYGIPVTYQDVKRVYEVRSAYTKGITKAKVVNKVSIYFVNREYDKDDYSRGGYYGIR